MATHDDEGRAPRAAVTAVRETGEPLRIGETGEDAANGDTAIVARNERTQEGYQTAVHRERVPTQADPSRSSSGPSPHALMHARAGHGDHRGPEARTTCCLQELCVDDGPSGDGSLYCGTCGERYPNASRTLPPGMMG